MDLLGALSKLQGEVRRLRARVDATVARAVVNVVNDSLKTQRLQITILAGETEPDVEHMQPYGFSFTPPAGSETLALAVGGMRAHTVGICTQNPDERPLGTPAREGGLYTNGQWVFYVDADGVGHVGAQRGTAPIALADKVDAEIARLWAAITPPSPTVTPAPASGPDVGEPGLIAFIGNASTAKAQVQSVAATKARAT